MILVFLVVYVIVCILVESLCYFCGFLWLVVGGVMVLVLVLLCVIVFVLINMFVGGNIFRKNFVFFSLRWLELDFFILLGMVGYVLSLGVSSFVEEEY